MLRLNLAPRIKTKVYVKPTNTGLLLPCYCHVDNRYKRSLITTMLGRAYRISSDWSYFSQECDRLETVFLKLKYPKHLFNLTVKQFVDSKVADQQQIPSTDTTPAPILVVIPFKDQVPFFLRDSRASETRGRVKITPREKRRHAVRREKNEGLQTKPKLLN